MRPDRFAPYDDDEGIDLEGVGITADDLDLSISNIDPADLAPSIEWSRWERPRQWWH